MQSIGLFRAVVQFLFQAVDLVLNLGLFGRVAGLHIGQFSVQHVELVLFSFMGAHGKFLIGVGRCVFYTRTEPLQEALSNKSHIT